MNLPQSRIEEFLKVLALSENPTKIPYPQSRVEEFLKAIITGNTTSMPQPQSRIEEYLQYMALNGGGSGGSSGGNSEGNSISFSDFADIELRPIYQAFGRETIPVVQIGNVEKFDSNIVIDLT